MIRKTLSLILCVLLIYPVVGFASDATGDEFEFLLSLAPGWGTEDLEQAQKSDDCTTLYKDAQKLIEQKEYERAQKILERLFWDYKYWGCPLRKQVEVELSYVKALRCLEKMNFFNPVYSFKRLDGKKWSFVLDTARTSLMEILKKHPDFYRIQEVKNFLKQVNIDEEVKKVLIENGGLTKVGEFPLNEWLAKVEKEELMNLREGFKEILNNYPEYYRGVELRYGAVKCLYLAGEKGFIDEAETLLSEAHTLTEKALRQDLYLCLADAYASAGDKAGMLKTLKKIKQEYPELEDTVKFKLVMLRSYNKLLKKNGVSEIEEAIKSGKEMREIALEGIKLMLTQNQKDYFGDYIRNIKGYYCQICPQIDLNGNYKESVNPELCEKYRGVLCAELGKTVSEILELVMEHLNLAINENNPAKLETTSEMGTWLFINAVFTSCNSGEFPGLCEKWVWVLRNKGRRFLQAQNYEFADIVYSNLIHSLSWVDYKEVLLEILLESLQGFPEEKRPSRILKVAESALIMDFDLDERFPRDEIKMKRIILKRVKSLMKGYQGERVALALR
ncbi:hypothetical protein J7M23_09125 [Candidatus Sumerlaeota bacterium]|nr:hypothetical protein [Candidatus Sumerlaeota bacterium]